MMKEPNYVHGESLSKKTMVVVFIMTRRITRCSQSAQVDDLAYQLHEPAGEEQTRHN